MNERVVVTGVGVVAANGTGLAEFWRTLLAGESGIGPITLFDASEHRVKIAGEVKGFDLREQVPFPVKPKRMGRHSQLALAAARMALEDAGIRPWEGGAELDIKLSLFVGVSSSAMDPLEMGMKQLGSRGAKSVSPLVVSASQPQAIASVLADSFGNIERVSTISTACAAGGDALGAAYQCVHEGRSDIVLVGAADAPVSPLAIGTFGSSGMIPDWNGDPKKACRPFDIQRQGGMISEGAGFFVLETLEHALARGATPYLEIVGYGSSLDLVGGTVCSGLDAAMREALANARALPSDIDFVCAHGPGDKQIDLCESRVIRSCIGETNPRVPVTSIKGSTGNPLSAAAPLQLAACAMAMRYDLIPPTANCDELDPACGIDVVRGKKRHAQINKAIMNVHGMGGTNSSLVVQRVLI